MTATTTVTGASDKAPVVEPPRKRGGILSRIAAPYKNSHGIQRFMLVSGTAVSLAFILMAIFAPLLAPYNFDTYRDAAGRFPTQGEPTDRNHWGTTVQGFDVLSRVIFGARTAVEVVFLAVTFSLAIGVPLGLISGYVGGWLDRILVLIMDALFAFPYLLLAIVAAFLLKDTIDSGIVVTAIAITVVYVPQYFRVVRASTLERARSHLHRGRTRHGRAAAHDHPPLPVRQRDPERARDRDAQRRGRDPHARRPRLPRPRHPAHRGGGVGL